MGYWYELFLQEQRKFKLNRIVYCVILFLIFFLKLWENIIVQADLIFSWNYFCDRSLTIGQMQGKFQMIVVRHTGHAIQVCTSHVFLHSLCYFWFSSLICNLTTCGLIFLGRCTWWICNSDCQLHFSEPNRPTWNCGISHADFFTTVLIVLILLTHL